MFEGCDPDPAPASVARLRAMARQLRASSLGEPWEEGWHWLDDLRGAVAKLSKRDHARLDRIRTRLESEADHVQP